MNKEKLKLYVNKGFLTKDLLVIPLLFPFFGAMFRGNSPYATKTYEYGFDPEYFELVSFVHDAEYVLIPYDYWQIQKRHPELLEQMIKEAQDAGKLILIDASGDAAGKIEVPNSRILRINQYRHDLSGNEITVPVPCEDLLESHGGGQIVLREKGETPIIGFVGWGRLSFKQRMRTIVKELPRRFLSLLIRRYAVYRKGVFWREKAIQIFERSSKVKTNFIIRASYSGNIRTMIGDPVKNREEFVKNILDSDYTLVVKGDANAATRFYETLALGRIPVVIDTECMFPLEGKINYREFCVFINYTDLKKAPEILADFHKKLSPEEFVAMQQKARYIFKDYLRSDAFSRHLAGMLKEHARNMVVEPVI